MDCKLRPGQSTGSFLACKKRVWMALREDLGGNIGMGVRQGRARWRLESQEFGTRGSSEKRTKKIFYLEFNYGASRTYHSARELRSSLVSSTDVLKLFARRCFLWRLAVAPNAVAIAIVEDCLIKVVSKAWGMGPIYSVPLPPPSLHCFPVFSWSIGGWLHKGGGGMNSSRVFEAHPGRKRRGLVGEHYQRRNRRHILGFFWHFFSWGSLSLNIRGSMEWERESIRRRASRGRVEISTSASLLLSSTTLSLSIFAGARAEKNPNPQVNRNRKYRNG